MKYFSIVAASIIFLSGCSESEMVSMDYAAPDPDFVTYTNTALHYVIDVPPNTFAAHPPSTNISARFTNYDELQPPPPTSGLHLTITGTTAPCSNALMGSSNTENFPGTGGDAIWGKVDIQSMMGVQSSNFVLCNAPKPVFDTEVNKPASYAVCSMKDGRAVVVCLEQVKDDQKIAKEIFETFKWAD